MNSITQRLIKPPILILLTVLIIALGFALRVYTLGDKAVWWDEAWSAIVAQESFAQTTFLTASDVHPPLYQWALHVWVRLAGISEFALRYLSTLYSALTLALVYALARRLGGNRRSALLALFFTALSVFFVHWAQETRMYAQASVLTALTVYAYLRVRDDQRYRVGWWAVLILSGAGVALTHYLGAFVLVIINVHWLLTLRERKRAFHLRWIVSQLFIGVLLALWVIYAIDLTRSGSVDNDFNAALIFQLVATLLAVGASVNLEQYTLIALIVVGVFFAGLVLYTRRNRSRALLVWMMALLPPLAIYALSLPETPFYAPKPEERYIIIFAPVVFAGLGLALDALLRLWKPLGAVAVIGLTVIYGASYLRDVDGRYMRDDYAMLHRTVDLLAQPDEPILFVSDDRYPLVYYHMNRADESNYSPYRITGITAPLGQVQDVNMERLLDGAERFWVVRIEQHFRDPDELTTQWFDERYTRLYEADVDYNGLILYTADDSRIPSSDEVLPPVISEARPGDVVRIGSPDPVLFCYIDPDDVTQCTDFENQLLVYPWNLYQFPIYGAYPNGDYTLRTAGASYDFTVTHSQAPVTSAPENLNADFGSMTLLGYDINSDILSQGDSFEVMLYWQVDAPISNDYTVFAQLIGAFREDGTPLWASDDSYPADTPTSALWKGHVFIDTHRLTIPDDMPAGAVQLHFGLYDLNTGERLTLPDGADAVIIPARVE